MIGWNSAQRNFTSIIFYKIGSWAVFKKGSTSFQQAVRSGAQEGRCAQAHGGAVHGQEEEGIHDPGEEEEAQGKLGLVPRAWVEGAWFLRPAN